MSQIHLKVKKMAVYCQIFVAIFAWLAKIILTLAYPNNN